MIPILWQTGGSSGESNIKPTSSSILGTRGILESIRITINLGTQSSHHDNINKSAIFPENGTPRNSLDVNTYLECDKIHKPEKNGV